MENFLMNVFGVAAIAGILYAMFVMWRNIDRELAKMETPKKKPTPFFQESASRFNLYNRQVGASIPSCHH